MGTESDVMILIDIDLDKLDFLSSFGGVTSIASAKSMTINAQGTVVANVGSRVVVDIQVSAKWTVDSDFAVSEVVQ